MKILVDQMPKDCRECVVYSTCFTHDIISEKCKVLAIDSLSKESESNNTKVEISKFNTKIRYVKDSWWNIIENGDFAIIYNSDEDKYDIAICIKTEQDIIFHYKDGYDSYDEMLAWGNENDIHYVCKQSEQLIEEGYLNFQQMEYIIKNIIPEPERFILIAKKE